MKKLKRWIERIIFGKAIQGEKLETPNINAVHTSYPQENLNFNNWAVKLEVSSAYKRK